LRAQNSRIANLNGHIGLIRVNATIPDISKFPGPMIASGR
jgi:hypothetical protein